MEELKSQIQELEARIAELPIGYISRKTINGKVKLYHQWTEDGKKKSKYLSDAAAEQLAAQIAKRRALQEELKKLKSQLPKEPKPTAKVAEPAFITNVLTGTALQNYTKMVRGFKKRDCYRRLTRFLQTDASGKVLILFGLRRTGKTTLIRQAIRSLSPEDFQRTAFIQIQTGNTLAEINRDMKLLAASGYQYVFLDEVTLMEDFIEGAALFSDIYAASGMKIVLSGTDSLGFLFSEDEQLYDRCILLHTTWIPYREFDRVLGISGIDEYIRYGGTMSLGGKHYNETSTFATAQSTDEYIDSSIARNIQHSLRYYQAEGHFRSLQALYERNELTSAINRIIEDINHRFTIEVLTRDFVSHDLGLSARNLRRDREHPTDVLDRIDKEAFTEGLRQALEIRNRPEQSVKITDAHRTEIKEYLDLLDLTVDIPVESIPVQEATSFRTAIAQPGMRYAQAEALIRQLLLDKAFQDISAVDRAAICERILDEIRGRMMEDIVLLETKMAFPKKQVFKLQFPIGEFDMVIADPAAVTCELYELKHSTEAVPEQYRHLADPEKCKAAAFRFGEITRKAVIYRGPAGTDGEIEYLNVEDYLKSLPTSR